jgi:5,10-methylenetetrahydromethanopterin reductase
VDVADSAADLSRVLVLGLRGDRRLNRHKVARRRRLLDWSAGGEIEMELWAMRIPEAGTVVAQAERAEAAGWDGVTFTDSQNLVADPFVAVALAAMATERLRFATGVTNAYTRHPAALANVAATVQETSGGRFVLGIGRGDTALFHLGRQPMKVDTFAALVTDLQTYLANGTIDIDGRPSRMQWLDRAQQPKVPLDLAVSGPRMIELGGRIAEQVTFAVGADPDRMAWAIDLARSAAMEAGRDPDAISFGAYVNVGCHPDPDVARELIRGGVAAFAHFSSMPGSTGAGLADDDRAVVAEVGRRYDSNVHLSNTAAHTDALKPEFVERFAVVGPPTQCVDRLRSLAELGLERFVITGPSFRADREHARTAEQLLTREVLPAIREGAPSWATTS